MATIAEIGTNRLINVLVRDKNQSPARTLAILKSEITALLESYLELDDEINIKMEEERGRLTFKINATAVRVKDFGTVFD
ncbi:MAG: cell division topological specificity factor MinE [Firmicutes bacterium]|nr:cell division topological specificity factor MinE [Bacillota bacterium]